MNNFYNTDLKEQETTINIDYFERNISIYTCRKSVYNRLLKKIGNPTKIYYLKNQMSGVRWIIPCNDRKKIRAILSSPTLIGQIK